MKSFILGFWSRDHETGWHLLMVLIGFPVIIFLLAPYVDQTSLRFSVILFSILALRATLSYLVRLAASKVQKNAERKRSNDE